MAATLFRILFLLGIFYSTLQNCPREISFRGISVTWHPTPTAENIESDPQCFLNETLITRNCTDSVWSPALDDLAPCLKVVKYFDLTACPPGFRKVTEGNNEYCYQLGESTAWNYPCLNSGGASVITDLSSSEFSHLMSSLKATNISKYFWVPAHRQKLFQPVVWSIPGPNWGQRVIPENHLRFNLNLFKNCLLLDIEQNILITETCTKIFPSLCFYLNDLHYPATCPLGYHAFRFTPDNGACYGIAHSDTPAGLTFVDFFNKKCTKPMSDQHDLSRFIFKKISEMNALPNDVWCWLKARHYEPVQIADTSYFNNFEGIINNAGMVGLIDLNVSLPCMACRAEIIYRETEFMFEYNDVQNLIYLTVYHPSGLWKYNSNDRGIQCFSDAKGFVRVINVDDDPFIEVKPLQIQDSELAQIEKIVYVIHLVTNTSGQYWCEGHTVNFSLITTEKMVVNPRGNNIHVFSLTIKTFMLIDEEQNITELGDLVMNIDKIFNAKNVLLMDIFDYDLDEMFILLHLHVTIADVLDDTALNIQATYSTLKMIADSELLIYNYTLINLSSSVYCLPTSSVDTIQLDWEMTPIGHISAPKQFCLQSNGLPVKRLCGGSYMFGSIWGEVEGHCDNTYAPSTTTAFLYNFVKRSDGHVSRFLTEGLSFVLSDTDIFIPADIYYLSMSLQQISDIGQDNFTSLDTDINHITWVMDRVMVLDCEYLRLAQTLNSTNVIVDSISDIIEILANQNLKTPQVSKVTFQLAVEPNFVVQIAYPDANNITGIAIVNNTESEYFTDMLIHPLYKNTTLEDVLSIENLEIASWLPTNVLDALLLNDNKTKNVRDEDNLLQIIITIYHNDAVFQELQNNDHMINSRIIGVSIPYFMSNLEYPIPILFKQINQSNKSFCGYWEFQSQQKNHFPGSWKKEGCFLVQTINDITVCECYHLTHFGQLFFNNGNVESAHTIVHTIVLNIITVVGSFLSLFGIAGIWITALVFSNWRKKAGTKVLLQLSTAVALPLVFIVIFNLDLSMFIKENDRYKIAKHRKTTCIVLGALLHYSILASFMWMLITAVLQFVRYVRVLGVRRPARFMFKFTLIGWGIPLLPVIVTLSLNYHNYIPTPSAIRKICYPSGNYLIVAVLIPISIILCVNVTLFILVLYAISKRSNKKMKSTDMGLVGAQLRVSVFLFFLLGLTWVFGIFSFSNNLIWSYLFCLTSTLQGFVLFIYFVICDPNTRGLWVTLMTPQFNFSSSRNSITSITAG